MPFQTCWKADGRKMGKTRGLPNFATTTNIPGSNKKRKTETTKQKQIYNFQKRNKKVQKRK
jgi:hypothetical protein